MLETCFLHIGTEKTGTKSIQAFMHANHAALVARGFLYPRSLGPNNHRRLRNFAADTHQHLMGAEVREHPDGVEGFRHQLTREFEAEISDTPCHSLIVSDEHFQSCLTSLQEIHRLRGFLERCCKRIRVIVYLRRQDLLCLSFYSEYIKTGYSDDAPLHEKGVTYYYDYAALIQNYETVFGSGSVTVRIFETSRLTNANVVDDFNAVIGLKGADTLAPVSRKNASLSPLGLKFLAEFNQHVPHAVGDRLNPERADLRGWLDEHFAGAGWPVPRQWGIDFLQRYRAINEWVRNRFFPEQASLFDEDFSSYPTSIPHRHYGFADAVQVATVLWREQAKALRSSRSHVVRLQADVAARDGHIKLLEGNRDAAMQHLRRALVLNPDHQLAQTLLGRLSTIRR